MVFALTVALPAWCQTPLATYEGSDRLQHITEAAKKEGPLTPHTTIAEKGLPDPGWDARAVATPHGQFVSFAEFLAATGAFERWVSACPLAYLSGNAPDKRDVLGTLMRSLLAGHRRYAHITALRMNKVVSDDALRPSLMHSACEALSNPRVLDIDARITPAAREITLHEQVLTRLKAL